MYIIARHRPLQAPTYQPCQPIRCQAGVQTRKGSGDTVALFDLRPPSLRAGACGSRPTWRIPTFSYPATLLFYLPFTVSIASYLPTCLPSHPRSHSQTRCSWCKQRVCLITSWLFPPLCLFLGWLAALNTRRLLFCFQRDERGCQGQNGVVQTTILIRQPSEVFGPFPSCRLGETPLHQLPSDTNRTSQLGQVGKQANRQPNKPSNSDKTRQQHI